MCHICGVIKLTAVVVPLTLKVKSANMTILLVHNDMSTLQNQIYKFYTKFDYGGC